ncbi:putative death-receptor fusion protein-domain-containing protein [Lasiosphaeria miniovina]|uniref:Death-receptor fusion protein-domain-containing protein n=1 Tax=Lasiosphaeria miniovina TaxID=1954250 RepID=A0AA40AVN8_9PEZI|nr:putative death-receptor fusion protein-domain-containing protein [Lasiosphaeria miniovina]KAK0722821.1 putative death-receptor fusion protein-domain-containing protein [Lasiosphaeria miniovina]
METTSTPEASTSHADTLLAGVDSKVLVNANTISQWLLSQPDNLRPRIAQELFEKLLRDASQSRQYNATGHACVKLCSFVQQCAKSSDEALKQWAFTETLSKRLFHFYLEWYEHDPHRALRLTLDILVMTSTLNPSPQTGQAIKGHVVETLVAIVARRSTRQLTKSGLQCLDHLLSKRAVSLDEIGRNYSETQPSMAGVPELYLWRSFVFYLFSWMEVTYVSPLAGKCVVHIFRGLETAAPQTDSVFTAELWQRWLQDACIKNPAIMDDTRNYILVPVFKTDRAASLRLLQAFIKRDPLTAVEHRLGDQTLLLQLATLELGKRFGLVEEPSDGVSQPLAHISLQETVLDNLLTYPSPSVRSSAFSLLISSQATTKPFSQVAFSLLKRHIAAFHADYDAKFRNEMLSLSKSLIRRVKNVLSVAQRSLSRPAHLRTREINADATVPSPKKRFGPEAALKDEAEAHEIINRHEAFLRWYIDFLKGELLPTASYQRHITAIRAALLVLKVGKHAGASDDGVDIDVARIIAFDATWIRLLVDLTLDPFDDVRDGATTLLALFPQEIVKAPSAFARDSGTLLDILEEFSLKAQALANRTGRADHGDGVARSQGLFATWLDNPESQIAFSSKLIQGLEGKILKAEQDLGHAAIESPVHADFASISYVWQVLARTTYSDDHLKVVHQLHRRIVDCSKRIWLAVKHVLCDDSPEGHLPEELEDIEGLDTKDLLSYSFRAVHESSNLLRLIVGTLRLKRAPGAPFPTPDVFKDAGYLTFEQLASLRHRGAFSTVSLTFATYCQLTQNLRDAFPEVEGLDGLLHEWYQGTITCIMTQASTTRRSAGIPSLIAAILLANVQSPSFGEVFNTLGEIGKKTVRLSETDGSNLPQVHALNCLREIFRSSVLSKKAESYLGMALNLAANSLKSEVWAIRNCGLLLLRSLIDCLLGTGESKAIIESGWDGHSVRISYKKYPTLPGVILGLLQSVDGVLDVVSQSGAAEAVFPALDIIRRAGPPEEHRAELRKHIEGYLGSRIWHVREIAAKTLCSFLLQEDWITEVESLLGQFEKHANGLHGTLLAARFVLERKADLGHHVKSDSTRVKQVLQGHFQSSGLFQNCPEIEAAYLEITNLLTSLDLDKEQADKAASYTMLPVYTDSSSPKHHSSSALLDMQISMKVVYDTAALADVDKLRSCLSDTLKRDINTATRMLETIPSAWGSVQGGKAKAELCAMYASICKLPGATEARTQALLNLGSVVDDSLSNHDVQDLPSLAKLDMLWDHLLEEEINPTLSCAIITTSGSLMAASLSLPSDLDNTAKVDQRLMSWGELIADALDADNAFDTRFAAAMALRSFFLDSRRHSWNSKYLPVLSALYDALIDDDDEVREVAASAATGIIGTYMLAPTAADRLVVWLREHFREREEFRSLVICRMTGHTPHLRDIEMIPADQQLIKTMDFDDSLFAAEEQNLFIDEVKETMRWRQALYDFGQWKGDAPFENLVQWTDSGLAYLIQLSEKEDGPLGWTSDQHVFAVCARVLLSAVAITAAGKVSTTKSLLEQFKHVGTRARIHGSLLEMALSEADI